jgi:ABC-type sulfate transport system substrate-binding protein
VKETLPVGGFKAIDPKVTAKFADKSVGDVAASYGADVKNVLDREDAADYDKLSAADKAVVNAYIKSTYEVDAAADAAGAKSAYNSIKFLHDL